ncbi:hypothetical protein [Marinactinospora rubrisoli]|uniref:Uncharacterized protein n=1 Tax=Marinactinospora rubrisoli TaxID=2715399 RepID=A0ABW2KL64_9ACTN
MKPVLMAELAAGTLALTATLAAGTPAPAMLVPPPCRPAAVTACCSPEPRDRATAGHLGCLRPPVPPPDAPGILGGCAAPPRPSAPAAERGRRTGCERARILLPVSTGAALLTAVGAAVIAHRRLRALPAADGC